MNDISSRLYADEKDFQAMLELLTTVRPRAHLSDYPRKLDIEENLGSPAIRANTRLWFDGDQPVGWAYVDELNNLWWELDRRNEGLLGNEIVDWGGICVRRGLDKGESAALDTSCREDYAARIAFLKGHGFQQTETATLRMVSDLSEPIPEPRLPSGFVIRSLAGLQEAEAVAATHRLAFGTDYMTTENRLAIMQTSEYEPSLDLVVIAPDGAIVANCICSVNEQEKTGATDPVSTHPGYQRLGLARALLARGMQLLRERGMLSAHLGTSSDNAAMQKTAEAVGFFITHKIIWFSKEIH